MQLTIILTSYNRPLFVTRAIESMRRQTADNWWLIVMDDNSSAETQQAILDCSNDRRIHIMCHQTTEAERSQTARYASLINSILPHIRTPLVGYMCDNVEYEPEMVAAVTDYFTTNPNAFSGYVLHQRDMWSKDGRTYLGQASDYGHWNHTPPIADVVYSHANGFLDHSQVFHRLPVKARWEENYATVKNGDGIFFGRLIFSHGPIRPIQPGHVLSREHLIA